MALTITGTDIASPTGYTTAAEIKVILGITGTDQDALIARLNPAMQSVLNTMLGIDNLLDTDYTDELVYHAGGFDLDVHNPGVTALTALKELESGDTIDVTGWSVVKYDDRTIMLDTYLNPGKYLVTYSAGTLDADEDIKLAVAYLVAGAMSEQAKNPTTVSYSMHGVAVNFRDESERSFVNVIIDNFLGRYKPLGLIRAI